MSRQRLRIGLIGQGFMGRADPNASRKDQPSLPNFEDAQGVPLALDAVERSGQMRQWAATELR